MKKELNANSIESYDTGKKNLYEYYGTPERLLEMLRPENQAYCLQNELKCYRGNSPSILTVKCFFGYDVIDHWIRLQLDDLNKTSTTKQMSDIQINYLTKHMIDNWTFVKLSELMLFLAKYKRGDFFADPKHVTPLEFLAELCFFAKKKQSEIDRLSRENKAQKTASN